MKNKTLYLSVGLAFCAASYSAAEDATSKDEQKLEQTSSEVDKGASSPEGGKAVETRLKSEFKVDDARIQSLRDQKMGYGEISIALSLAEKLPGGITDANVKIIMDQRQGPPVMGWGQIAKKQGTTLGKVIGRVKSVEAAARKQEKQARKLDRSSGKAEKADRPEKASRPERAEKHERTERPAHGKP